MQNAGNHFLTGTRCTGNQHPAVGRGDALDGEFQVVYLRGFADQVSDSIGPDTQLAVFPPQFGGFNGAINGQQQTVGLEGLFDEVVGALLDGSDSGFDSAMA